MSELEKSVLLGMRLLGATNNPRAAYENVSGGEAAWDMLIAKKLIVRDGVFYVLSYLGKEAASKIRE